MILLRTLLVSLTIFIIACGGGGDKETSSSPEATDPPTTELPPTSTDTAFTDISAPDNFDWSMQSKAKITMKLVSNFNDNNFSNRPLSSDSQSLRPQLDGMSVSGKHIVKVFGIDQDNNVITTAAFTGMTNKFGELPVTFNIPDTWLGLIVDVDLDDITCSQRIELSEIQSLIALGCDIEVTSDL
jgi:hypothetical protein